jgi:hypothetical protein
MLDAILEATRHRCQHAPDSSDAKKKETKATNEKKKNLTGAFRVGFSSIMADPLA